MEREHKNVAVEISKIIGYSIGTSISYILNKNFTFQSKNSHIEELPNFLISVGAIYVLNFITSLFCVHVLITNPYISQIISGGIYTLGGFIFLKYFAFSQKLTQRSGIKLEK